MGISVGGHGEVVGDALADGPGLEDVDGHGSDRVDAVEVDRAQALEPSGQGQGEHAVQRRVDDQQVMDGGQGRARTCSVANTGSPDSAANRHGPLPAVNCRRSALAATRCWPPGGSAGPAPRGCSARPRRGFRSTPQVNRCRHDPQPSTVRLAAVRPSASPHSRSYTALHCGASCRIGSNGGQPRPSVTNFDSQAIVHHGRGATYILRPVWTQVRLHEILSPLWRAGNGSSIHSECATPRLLPRLR